MQGRELPNRAHMFKEVFIVKKLFAFMLAGIFAISLCYCSPSKNSTDSDVDRYVPSATKEQLCMESDDIVVVVTEDTEIKDVTVGGVREDYKFRILIAKLRVEKSIKGLYQAGEIIYLFQYGYKKTSSMIFAEKGKKYLLFARTMSEESINNLREKDNMYYPNSVMGLNPYNSLHTLNEQDEFLNLSDWQKEDFAGITNVQGIQELWEQLRADYFKQAEDIVVVNAEEVDFYPAQYYTSSTYEVSTLKVEQNIKGDLQPGQKIYFYQIAEGTYGHDDVATPPYAFLQKGERYLLFLQKYDRSKHDMTPSRNYLDSEISIYETYGNIKYGYGTFGGYGYKLDGNDRLIKVYNYNGNLGAVETVDDIKALWQKIEANAATTTTAEITTQ